MSTLHINQESVFLESLQTRISERLGDDFKIALPEWDLVKSTIHLHTKYPPQYETSSRNEMVIRVDFRFIANDLFNK